MASGTGAGRGVRGSLYGRTEARQAGRRRVRNEGRTHWLVRCLPAVILLDDSSPPHTQPDPETLLGASTQPPGILSLRSLIHPTTLLARGCPVTVGLGLFLRLPIDLVDVQSTPPPSPLSCLCRSSVNPFHAPPLGVLPALPGRDPHLRCHCDGDGGPHGAAAHRDVGGEYGWGRRGNK